MNNRYLLILSVIISSFLVFINKVSLWYFLIYVVLIFAGLIFTNYMINAFLKEIDTILEYRKTKQKRF